MATLDEMRKAVDDFLKTAKNDTTARLVKLNKAGAEFDAPTVREDVQDFRNPALPLGLFVQSTPGGTRVEREKFLESLGKIEARVGTAHTKMEALPKPPAISFSGSPLDGWSGLDGALAGVWSNDNPLKAVQWNGTAVQSAYALIASTLNDPSANLLVAGTALSDRSGVFYTMAFGKLRSSGNARLDSAARAELGVMQGFSALDMIRTMDVLLEEHARTLYTSSVKQGLALDELIQKFSLTYGTIYAKLTDILIDKATKETDWFFKDFMARAEMQSKAGKVNANLYLETLNGALGIITDETEMNIKAVLANFENSLKQISVEMGFEKLDKSHLLDQAGIDIAMFKAQIESIYQEASIKMDQYANAHNLKVGAFASLANGYSGLVQTASQGTLTIATQKK